MSRRVFLLLSLLFIPSLAWASRSTGGDISVYFGKIVGIASRITGGNYVITHTLGENIGVTRMAGGAYTLSPSILQAVNKLEKDLSRAHCYPNPFKPHSGLGHIRITFSRLTAYTKLRVFNLAGELVYEEERDTPWGELSWDVVNNSGDKLASGVYIYLITDDEGHRARGKFAVIK